GTAPRSRFGILHGPRKFLLWIKGVCYGLRHKSLDYALRGSGQGARRYAQGTGEPSTQVIVIQLPPHVEVGGTNRDAKEIRQPAGDPFGCIQKLVVVDLYAGNIEGSYCNPRGW